MMFDADETPLSSRNVRLFEVQEFAVAAEIKARSGR